MKFVSIGRGTIGGLASFWREATDFLSHTSTEASRRWPPRPGVIPGQRPDLRL
ncbi:hypothetical protein APR04_001327 [Promicromonospora umidemergens]|nr:hypothetical protein [Promicromonospora umidemergens]